MFSDLPMFKIIDAMARHAAESQKVSATNIAHADQPGYKAKRIETFDAFLRRMPMEGASSDFKTHQADTHQSPNGNSVSLETELFNSADAMNQHKLALSIYTKSLDMLRTAIGRRG